MTAKDKALDVLGAVVATLSFSQRRRQRRARNRVADMLLYHGSMRNRRCPCGSGKKFKHCCGAVKQTKARWSAGRKRHAARRIAKQMYEKLAHPKQQETSE